MKRILLFTIAAILALQATQAHTQHQADSLINQALQLLRARTDIERGLELLKRSEGYYLPTCGVNSLEMAYIWHYESICYLFMREYSQAIQASEKAWTIAFDSLGYEAPFTREVQECYTHCALQNDNHIYYERIKKRCYITTNAARQVNNLPAAGLAFSGDEDVILFPAVFDEVGVDSTEHFAYLSYHDITLLYDLTQHQIVHTYPFSIYNDELIVLAQDSACSVLQLGAYIIDTHGNLLDDQASSIIFSPAGDDSILVDNRIYNYQYMIPKSAISQYNRLGAVFANNSMPQSVAELKLVMELGNNCLQVTEDGTKYGIVARDDRQLRLLAEPQFESINEIDLTQHYYALDKAGRSWILYASTGKIVPVSYDKPVEFCFFLSRYQDKDWFIAYEKYERQLLVNSDGMVYELPLLSYFQYGEKDSELEYFDGYNIHAFTSQSANRLIKSIITRDGMSVNSGQRYQSTWENDVNHDIKYHVELQIEYPTEITPLGQNVRYWISNLLHEETALQIKRSIDAYESADDISPLGMYAYYLSEMRSQAASYNPDIDSPFELYFSFSKIAQSKRLVTYRCADVIDLGGSHGGMTLIFRTFDLETGNPLTLQDLVRPDAVDKVYRLLQEKIFTEVKACWRDGDSIYYHDEFPEAIYAPCALMPDGLIFCFQPYDLSRIYTDGIYLAKIPFSDLDECLTEVAKPSMRFIHKPKKSLSDNPVVNLEGIGNQQGHPGYHFVKMRQEVDSLIQIKKTQQAICIEEDYCSSLFQQHGYCVNVERSMHRLVDYYSTTGNDSACVKYASRLLKRLWLHHDQYEGNYWELDNIIDVSRTLARHNSALGNDSIAILTLQSIGDSITESIIAAECATYELRLGNTQSATQLANLSLDLLSNGKYTDDMQQWMANDLPVIATYSEDERLRSQAYNGTLLSKNTSLETNLAISQIILSSQDTSAINKYKQLLDLKKRLNNLLEFRDRPGIKEKIQLLSDSIDALEKRVMQLSMAYGDYKRRVNIGLEDLRRNLHPGEVAIEFVASEQIRHTEYIAAVIRYGHQVPDIVPLCLDSQLNETDSLYYLIWQPLESYMRGADKVFFSPAGQLYNIAVESVMDPSMCQTMTEKYALYRLSSTREVVIRRDPYYIRQAQRAAHAAVLFGGLDYDSMGGSPAVPVEGSLRSVFSLDREARASIAGFDYLPGTKQEVGAIQRLLLGSGGSYDNVITYTDREGTETTFKSLTGHAVDILHIATHGFYLPEQDSGSVMRDVRIISAASADIIITDKELLRSGLLFAGANNALLGVESDEENDDGILTSLEIASMDLSGLDMVVLSACETALGDVKGDGVYGLQRGFKKAGARTLLMSLHAVDDTATQLLMTEFYRNLLDGKSKCEALLAAQRYLRQCDGGRYDNPEYWAAFVLLDALD